MANRRELARQELENVLIKHLRTRTSSLSLDIGWATAKEIAIEVGYPLNKVSKALVSLANANMIEARETDWISSRYRTRSCNVYRMIALTAVYPAWLMPQAPVMVSGSCRVIRVKG